MVPVKWASITYLCVCCWFHTLLLLKFEFYFQLKLELWSYIFHISFRNSLNLFTKIYPSQLFFQNNNSRLSSGKEVSIKKNCYQALSLILCISERELTLYLLSTTPPPLLLMGWGSLPNNISIQTHPSSQGGEGVFDTLGL